MSRAACPGGGTGRHTILRGWRRKVCGFESRPGHSERSLRVQATRGLFSFRGFEGPYSPIWMASEGRVRPELPAPKPFIAYGGALGSATWQALPEIADLPCAARGSALAAPLDALHPYLPRVRWRRERPAHLAFGARGLPAVGAIHPCAYRGPFREPDTLLAFGAPPPRARGQADGLRGRRIRAEKTLGAPRGLSAQAARSTTPMIVMAAAHQPGRAGVPSISRCGIAVLPFLPHAKGNADAYQQPILFRGKSSADVLFRALRIDHALAVSAIRLVVPGLKQAGQRRLTLGT